MIVFEFKFKLEALFLMFYFQDENNHDPIFAPSEYNATISEIANAGMNMTVASCCFSGHKSFSPLPDFASLPLGLNHLKDL